MGRGLDPQTKQNNRCDGFARAHSEKGS